MPKTIFEAYNGCKALLEKAGIEDYVFESKQIIRFVTGLSNLEIINNPMKQLTEFEENNLTAIIKQRSIHYPLQYILRSWDFYGRRFSVGPGVLIPRADTEAVVEKSLKIIKDKKNPKILDLCAGSGCIGITLAGERTDASVIMVEKYNEALRYTEKNIAQNGINNAAAVRGDVECGDFADRKYDLIVSNPPYITKKDMQNLQKEVTFEPETALSGGEDGLKFYRAIVKNYAGALEKGGAMCFEVGIGQAEEVAGIMREAGLKNIGFAQDAEGRQRVVFGTAKGL